MTQEPTTPAVDAVAEPLPETAVAKDDQDKATQLEQSEAANQTKAAAVTKKRRRSAAGNAARAVSGPWASIAAILLAILWTIPTAGLLITSFRLPRDIRKNGWWNAFTSPPYTWDNYIRVFRGSATSAPLTDALINSIVITVPAVVLPLLLASLAAYAFAWIKFKGRDILFVCLFALQIVPLQVALIPLMHMYGAVGLRGTFWTVWISHAIFGLPLAVFLLHNFMKELPVSLLEAARVDGAGHVQIFFRIVLPLMAPALASFGIFQFLWVWNDLLVSLIFLGGTAEYAPLTVRVANDVLGTRGQNWHLLSAAAFVAMIVPVAVFVGLQRYFVRGLLAGGVKG